jgi:hypothetical protein
MVEPFYGPSAPCLDTLVLPALQRLQAPEKLIGNDPLGALESFISKSGCRLEAVLITGKRAIPKAMYVTAFPLIPKLHFNSRYPCGWPPDDWYLKDANEYIPEILHYMH